MTSINTHTHHTHNSATDEVSLPTLSYGAVDTQPTHMSSSTSTFMSTAASTPKIGYVKVPDYI